jgi:hypothetical protein
MLSRDRRIWYGIYALVVRIRLISWPTHCHLPTPEISSQVHLRTRSPRLLVGTLRTWKKRRNLSIQLIEGRSPFAVEGQGNSCTVGVCPLPVFDREESDVHVRLYLRFCDVVNPCKSQQRDEVLGKWPCGPLGTFALPRLGR